MTSILEDRQYQIAKSCITGRPLNEEDFVKCFTEGDKFLLTEGEHWDFKADWPFSRSNEYYLDLINHICAFSNNEGGYLIFNVHDETRKFANSKVKINTDSFLQGLSNHLNFNVENLKIKFINYNVFGNEHCAIFIPARDISLPAAFINVKNHPKYSSRNIYFRTINESKKITEDKFRKLLFRESEFSEKFRPPAITIPDRPTTIRKFVGRIHVLTEVVEWLNDPDSSICYLHGIGGSGKSTIAWKLCQMLKESDTSPRFGKDLVFDAVCFLSAKQIRMNTESSNQEQIDLSDFYDERSLRCAILKAGQYFSDDSEMDNLDNEEIEQALKDLFEINNMLIVIDDIDTLTTKDVDPGLAKLHRFANRSDGVKLLFTLRDKPQLAQDSAIEVLGLDDGELLSFCKTCADQFRIPPPPTDLVTSKIRQVTDGRPLAVETLLGLMRRADSYERAIGLYKATGGADLRNYLFMREWEAIPEDRLGREVLCLIALMNRPVNFGEIEILLSKSADQISDAIATVKEMFLIASKSTPVSYEIGPLPRSFILEMLDTVKFSQALRRKVSTYKAEAKQTPQELIKLSHRIERYIPPAKWHRFVPTANRDLGADEEAAVNNARNELMRADSIHEEDPHFRSLRAYTNSIGQRQNPQKVWEDVKHIIGFSKTIHPNHIAAITNCIVEGSFKNSIELFDHVINCKTYRAREVFFVKKAISRSYFNEAKNVSAEDFDESYKLALESIKLNLECYAYATSSLQVADEADRVAKFAANTLSWLLNNLNIQSHYRIYRSLSEIMKGKNIVCDPVLEPLGSRLRRANPTNLTPAGIGQLKSSLQQLRDVATNAEWVNTLAVKELTEDIGILEHRLR